MFASLGDMITALEGTGDLRRVPDVTSPILDIARHADRERLREAPSLSSAARAFDPDHATLGGQALLFEHVEGCDFPVVINLFGSYRRMELALGCDASGGFTAIADRIASLTKPEPPKSLREALAKGREFLPLLRIPPKTVKRGPCQEVVRLTERGDVDLTRLPIIKCWPYDGDPSAVGYAMTPADAGTSAGQGRYITLAGMHTIHADDRDVSRPSSHNIGMYRAQLIDETHLAMHWHMHHDGAAHWRSWKRLGQAMPIAICLGGESVMPYAATAPLPPGISELLMAGFLNGRGIPLVRGVTVPIRVPANSEIVIEGYVSTECGPIGYDPRSGEALGPGAVFEGPFGDHTGFYSLPDRYPIVTVTAITHRRQAVYPTTIVGLPPQEDYYLGKATERIFFPLLQTIIHDITDYHLPMFGCFHNCAFVQIDKAYPLQARRVMHAIWGAGQMAWTKMIVVVDTSVNVHDEQAVLRAIAEHAHLARDVEIVNGPLDILDHAAPRLGAGGKIGIDATSAWPGEEVNGIAVDADLHVGPIDTDVLRANLGAPVMRVHAPASGVNRCTVIGVRKAGPGLGGEVIERSWRPTGDRESDLTIVVDAYVDLDDDDAVLFHLLANADPIRDVYRSGGRLAFDATAKTADDARCGQPVRDFPPIVSFTPDDLDLPPAMMGR